MIIVLNLERAPHRKEIISKQLEELELEYMFFPAFDGKDMINASMQVPIVTGSGLGRKLEKAEIAIIMTHMAALKYAQIQEFKEVIILEDDVVLCEDWKDRLEKLYEMLPEDWEYVYLAGHSDYRAIPKVETHTVIPAPKMVGAFSYIVNPMAISKLIKYTSQFVTTYDDMITLKIEKNKLNGYLYLPYMTYHNAKESYIWPETSQNHPSKQYFKNKI